MDPHGFSILDSLRDEFPDVKSVLMDRTALDRYRDLLSGAAQLGIPRFERLTAEEADAARETQQSKLGVEQEKIPAAEVADVLRCVLSYGEYPFLDRG